MIAIIPKNIEFASKRPMVLSRITMGVQAKHDPIQEQIIFSKIACITLKRTNFVKGNVPREQEMKIPTIKIKIKYTFAW